MGKKSREKVERRDGAMSFWHDQVDQAAAALAIARNDPTVDWLKTKTAALLGPIHGWRLEYPRDEEPPEIAALTDHLTALARLTEAAAKASPKLAHVFGPLLPQMLLLDIFAGCRPDDVPKELLLTRVHRLLPDNPITIAPDGSLQDWQHATLAHYQQLIDSRTLGTDGFDQAGTVAAAVARRGRPTGSHNYDPEIRQRDLARMKDYRRQKRSNRWIADTLGYNEKTVVAWLKDNAN